ncbi:aspartate/glutamate racemase family protein [Bradyrhizobium sp. RDT10]
MIGGMSWRSTALYYDRLNRAVERECGPHHSFAGQVWNLDYAKILAMVAAENWDGIANTLADAGRGLSRSGCEMVALTAVTAHNWYDAVRAASGGAVPHVLAGAARQLDRSSLRNVGVLGTHMTCHSAFVRDYLGGPNRDLVFLDRGAQGNIDGLIQTILTASDDRIVGSAILLRAIEALASHGAEAVVLACTELPLLLPLPETAVPLIDSVALHVDDICSQILSEIP